MRFLVEDCCGGRTELRSLVAEMLSRRGDERRAGDPVPLHRNLGPGRPRRGDPDARRRRAVPRLLGGSHPRGAVHPLALELLAARGHDTISFARSKELGRVRGGGRAGDPTPSSRCATAAAGETCPLPGLAARPGPLGLAGIPAAVTEPEAARRAFAACDHVLAERIGPLAATVGRSDDPAVALRRALAVVAHDGDAVPAARGGSARTPRSSSRPSSGTGSWPNGSRAERGAGTPLQRAPDRGHARGADRGAGAGVRGASQPRGHLVATLRGGLTSRDGGRLCGRPVRRRAPLQA